MKVTPAVGLMILKSKLMSTLEGMAMEVMHMKAFKALNLDRGQVTRQELR